MPKEVADFLSRIGNGRQPRTNGTRGILVKSEFETVLSCVTSCVSVEETVLPEPPLENLRDAVKALRRRIKSSSPSATTAN